jgi:pyruvate dehydrogenase E1 component alpha subunit
VGKRKSSKPRVQKARATPRGRALAASAARKSQPKPAAAKRPPPTPSAAKRRAANPAGKNAKAAPVKPRAAAKERPRAKSAGKAKAATPPPVAKRRGASAAASASTTPDWREVAADPERFYPVQTVLGADDSCRIRPEKLGIDLATVLGMYRTMVMIRVLDARMLLMQRQGRVGFWGPTRGQEAATIGSAAAFGPNDWILPALREAGAALHRGLPLREMIAQCLGNSGDPTQGRQMPCHYTFKAGNYVAMSSVIGTQIPHAVGVAMAAKIRGDDTVAAGYLGDGATSSTDFHAAMNAAAVARAPVVLICQNNQWAISVPICNQMATPTVAQKARAYGMEGVRVDGNDFLAVYLATRRAVEKARRGDGPTFLELLTYRVLGHSSSDDPTRYRDSAEVAKWEARDPVKRARAYLERVGLWNDRREEDLDGELNAEVAAAVREAEALPPVTLDSLVADVYATTPPHLAEQLARAKSEIA